MATELKLSIVVPTFNERGNVKELISRVSASLPAGGWEMIFVDDDSPDKTHELVKELSLRDPRVRCIHRIGRRGLAGACIEGMLSSAAPYVAVMDADLQHDESILPSMLQSLESGKDMAVGSRYASGGASSAGFSGVRQWGSNLATTLAKKTLSVQTSDPMSGFFMMNRRLFDDIAPQLSKDGFKLLLDILASSERPLDISEHTYSFRARNSGESKLDTLVTVDYLGLLLSKATGGVLPVRFLMFALVGLSGVAVHMSALVALMALLDGRFLAAQFIATMVAMTWNFVLNNQLTYRDRRLSGVAFLRGMLLFYAACSLGTIANVGASSWIHGFEYSSMLAGFAGAIIGSVFNYATTSVITWRR